MTKSIQLNTTGASVGKIWSSTFGRFWSWLKSIRDDMNEISTEELQQINLGFPLALCTLSWLWMLGIGQYSDINPFVGLGLHLACCGVLSLTFFLKLKTGFTQMMRCFLVWLLPAIAVFTLCTFTINGPEWLRIGDCKFVIDGKPVYDSNLRFNFPFVTSERIEIGAFEKKYGKNEAEATEIAKRAEKPKGGFRITLSFGNPDS